MTEASAFLSLLRDRRLGIMKGRNLPIIGGGRTARSEKEREKGIKTFGLKVENVSVSFVQWALYVENKCCLLMLIR